MRFYKLEAVGDGGSCVFSSFGSSGWLCVLYCIEMKWITNMIYVMFWNIWSWRMFFIYFSNSVSVFFVFAWLLQIALTISRHNHITFSSCLDAWWPGPSSCLLVISYHTSIIAYVFPLVYVFYKCQKGHAICKPRQGLKTKLFWLFNKISSFL